MLHHTALHCTALHCTTLTTLHYITLHYINYSMLQLQLQLQHTTTATTLCYTNYTTLQVELQLQLHYTTLHPAVVGDVTTATTAKNSAPTTFRSISGLPYEIYMNRGLNIVFQWICSAIHTSQTCTFPTVSYLWNFRHRLVWYYWYTPLLFVFVDGLLSKSHFHEFSGVPAWARIGRFYNPHPKNVWSWSYLHVVFGLK